MYPEYSDIFFCWNKVFEHFIKINPRELITTQLGNGFISDIVCRKTIVYENGNRHHFLFETFFVELKVKKTFFPLFVKFWILERIQDMS